MAERIVSTSSSSSSLQEMDERQSAADGKELNSKLKENSKKESKKLKSVKKERRYIERFLGDGVNFKAKLIGVRDVPQARGEKMAQETLQELKVQKKSSGEHKQKIVINISLEGLKIKEEKTKEMLYFHEVHKISFISQDASDNRAFGYIYGSPNNLHTFYAVKTDKAAQQIVMCMRDLFHVAFELKKKEIEQWRQQQVQQPLTDRSPSTSLGSQSNDGSVVSDSSVKIRDASSPTSLNSSNSSNFSCNSSNHSESPFETLMDTPPIGKGPASLLLDLTADGPRGNGGKLPVPEAQPTGDPFFSDPWGYLRSMSKSVDPSQIDPFVVLDSVEGQLAAVPQPFFDSASAISSAPCTLNPFPASDPFNTSFVNTPFNNYSSTPVPSLALAVAESADPQQVAAGAEDKYAALAEVSSIATTDVSSQIANTSVTESSLPNDSFVAASLDDGFSMADFVVRRQLSSPLPQSAAASTSVFSDLDPLGKNRPYVDKKDFFHDVKNPPKKVLKDLIAENPFDVSEFGSQSDDVAAAASLRPPPHAPPPLPPPFFHRSLTSPTSSLEDASMAGSSASSTSSVGSDTSSPRSEALLPPPPPPRPNMNLPAFLPPPPPLPPKHGSSHSSSSSDGSNSPTSDFPPEFGGTSVMLSTPPIPIPARRGRASFVSSSSNSISSSISMSSSSAQHSSAFSNGSSALGRNFLSDPNNNPPQSLWTDAVTSLPNDTKANAASWNDIKRAAAIIAANNRELEAEALTNRINQCNLSNPFARDIFLSPPPQSNVSRRQNNGPNGNLKHAKLGIFAKEEDPFEDDAFFAALKAEVAAGEPLTTAVPRMSNGKHTAWNSPFEDNFAAQNR